MAAILLVLLLLPTSLLAQSNRADEAHRLAQASEQRGDWAEACRFYDEAYHRDRSRTEYRDAYQRCLRQLHLQRRHRDPSYRKVLSRMTLSDALNVYEEVLSLLSHVYVDRSRTDLNALFQEGLKEVRLVLDDEAFRTDYLNGIRPEAIRAFKRRLETWPERKLESTAKVREEVIQVLNVAQQKLDERLLLRTVLALEFACGACNALDEYSLFLTPSHVAELQEALRGKTVGVGIDVAVVEGRLEISRVHPKSPAEDVGLAPHDRILKIDHQPVEQMPLEWVVDRLRGEIGSLLEMEVLSPGQMMPHPVKMSRRPVFVPSVEARILPETMDGDSIGYLRIASFQDTTLQEVRETMAQMRSYPGGGIKGLILDLRGNPGGLFTSSVRVAELFIGTGVIVYTQSQLRDYRDPKAPGNQKPFRADIINPFELPVVVLVDGDTASSAEVVAGALKEAFDRGRLGRLLGQTTYGKGSIQSLILLRKSPGGFRIRLTVAQLFAPTQKPIFGRGIVPHEFVNTEGDTCILDARERLLDLVRMSQMSPRMMMQ